MSPCANSLLHTQVIGLLHHVSARLLIKTNVSQRASNSVFGAYASEATSGATFPGCT
jgi:hypothetical protein